MQSRFSGGETRTSVSRDGTTLAIETTRPPSEALGPAKARKSFATRLVVSGLFDGQILCMRGGSMLDAARISG